MINDDLLDDLAADLDLDLLTELFSEQEATDHITRQNEKYGPLSFQQYRLWMQQQLDLTSNAYNVPRAYHLQSPVDITQLQSALQQVVNKHEILRTRYEGDVTPNQVIVPHTIELEVIEIDSFAQGIEKAQSLLTLPEVEQWFAKAFDLRSAPSMRAAWIPADIGGVLLLCNHHIASDAWSKPIILKDLVTAYLGHSIGDVALRYVDYAHWQQNYLQSAQGEQVVAYWQDYITASPESLDCPYTIHDNQQTNSHALRQSHVIEHDKKQQINAYCKTHNLTLSSFFMTVLQAVLSSLSKTQAFLIGVPTAGRNHPQISDIVGCFVNTQVYKNAVSIDASLLDAAKLNQKHTLAILEQDLIPYEWLAEQLNWPKEAQRHNYFQVMINYLEENKAQDLASSLNITPLSLPELQAKFELALDINVTEQKISCSIEADTSYYHAQFIEQFASLFTEYIEQLLACDGSQCVGAHAIGNAQQQQQLIALGQGDGETNEYTSLLAKLRHNSQVYADKVALTEAHDTLTYAQLWQRVEQGAQYLNQLGIQVEDRVGIRLDSKLQQVVTALSALRLGVTWVMLDKDLPDERLLSIQSQTHCQHMVCNDVSAYRERLPAHMAYIPFADLSSSISGSTVLPEPVPEQSAYVIFTSGSTGVPKGVVVSQGALSTHLHSVAKQFNYTSVDCGLCFASLGFDAGLEQALVPLTQGASAMLVEGRDCSTEQLGTLIDTHNISIVDLPPSYLHQCDYLGNVRACIVGGEGWHQTHFISAKQRFPNVTFYNAYGPTEAVISPTLWQAPSAQTDLSSTFAPIGTAVGNRQLYVLDSALRLVPKGVCGELYIAGNLAQGYLGRPDLTSAQFIANPFNNDGSRLYRTGDLVCWNEGGVLEYFSRADSQVKIRGFRIELGEVNAKINALENVSEAVVIAQKNGAQTRLVAYVVGQSLDVTHLKEALANELPSYMVPAIIMEIAAIPLNRNGKVDYQALPEPEISQTEFVLPEGEAELALAKVWQKALNLDDTQIGRFDNFFALGGDSISSLRVVAGAKEQGLTLSVADIFATDTLSSLAAKVQQSQAEVPEIIPVQTQYSPLSYAQSRQWFMWKLDPQASTYHIPGAMTLSGELNTQALEHAINAVFAKHAGLRTRFKEQNDGTVLQFIDSHHHFEMQHFDASVHSDEQLTELKQQLVTEPFNLDQGLLFRACLIKHHETQHELVVVMHHIISDGWSMAIIIKDFVAAYKGLSQGEELAVSAPALNYRDFAVWQKQWLAQGEEARQLAYWQAQLGDEHTPLALPFDLQSNASLNTCSARSLVMPTALKQQLEGLAKQHNTTLFSVLMSAWQLLLHCYTGQQDIRVGIPVANRNHAATQDMVGVFINTQVIRHEFSAEQTLSHVLGSMIATLNAAQAHQDLPFERLLEHMSVARDTDNSPLFQVMMNHQRVENNELQHLPNLTIGSAELPRTSAAFALTLNSMEEADGQLRLSIDYANKCFSEARIDALLQGLQQICVVLLNEPNQAVANLNILSEAQQQKLLRLGCCESFDTPTYLLAQLAKHAQLSPEKQALSSAHSTLHYQALWQHIEQKAAALVAQNVSSQRPVAICLHDKFDQACAILAVLRAGSHFVLIPPDTLATRLAHIQHIAQFNRVIVDGDESLFQQSQLQLLSWSTLQSTAAYLPALSDIHAQQLAYIIFTSGSTGVPKGVAVSHGELASHLQAVSQTYQYTPDDVTLGFASLSFDAGLEQVLTPLLVGARAHLEDGQSITPDMLTEIIAQQGISILDLPPSYLHQCTDLGAVRACIVGGEGWQQAHYDKVRQKFPQLTLFNAYGPTEAVISPTVWQSSDANTEVNSAFAPIGQPIGNRQVYVLDTSLRLLPEGAMGELYIAGTLAQGYVGRADLTAERFIANPFANDGSRLYRTGDLVHWQHDGQLAYLRRIDQQVKIRGFRIELAEIVSHLNAIAGVQEAVVVAEQHTENSRLVAYVVATNTDIEEIKTALSQQLPHYMVPAVFMLIDSIPLNRNGKIDYLGLPEAEQTYREFVAPEGQKECTLAKIWCDVLGLERVGRHDNFFALGGDSISSLRVIAKVKEHGLNLTLAALFEANSLIQCASNVSDTQTHDNFISRLPTPYAELSYAQQRQWFMWKLDPQSTAYHIPGALRLEGALDMTSLQSALNFVYAKHAGLRTRFKEGSDGSVTQFVSDDIACPLSYCHVKDGDSSDLRRFKRQLVHTPFNLVEGSLFRVGIIQHDQNVHELVVVMHHIIADGWSMAIIVKDFVKAYSSALLNETLKVTEQTIRYSDFAKWQKDWLAQGEEARQLHYWQNRLGDDHPVLRLPYDLAESPVNNTSKQLTYDFDADTKADLDVIAKRHGSTLFSVLMTAWQIVLNRYTGQDDIRVGMPSANRNHPQSQEIVGVFVNTQVINHHFKHDETLESVLTDIIAALKGAQANQDLPFERLVEQLDIPRDTAHSPLFQVMMNHQRQESNELETLSGLSISGTSLPQTHAAFGLALNTFEDERDQLSINLDYADECFSSRRIQSLMTAFKKVCQTLISAPDTAVANLRLLDDAESDELLKLSGAFETQQTSSNSILYALEALRNNDKKAVSEEFSSLSFQALWQSVEHVAGVLIAQGLQPEQAVGVCLNSKQEQVIAILAVLRAGGCFVVVPTNTSPKRFMHINQSASLKLCIIDDLNSDILHYTSHLCSFSWKSLIGKESANLPPISSIQPAQLAYIIFTSGSTGLPKGVAVSHGELSSHIVAMTKALSYTAKDASLVFASLSFDAGLEQLLVALTNGTHAHLVDGQQLAPHSLTELLSEHHLSVIDLPPSYLHQCLDLDQVRTCIVGGEGWQQAHYSSARARFEEVKFFNAYGPTEAVISPTLWQAPASCLQVDSGYAPIGVAVGSRQMLILDDGLNLLPRGAIGELYIAGHLARGYVGRADLTAERFIANPFADDGSRLYRTGDQVLWQSDGQLAYLGRLDQQVKVRGFRVELGEIEAQLQALKEVSNAVVIADMHQNSTRLVAYVVSARTDEEAIKAALGPLLPSYMIPAVVMSVDHIPLNHNGKVDYKALPSPSSIQLDFIAPEGELEQRLAEIWCEVLGVERVGRGDNFFARGGDSILALQVIAKVRQAGYLLSPKQIFEAPSLSSQAAVFSPLEDHHVIPQIVSGSVPLLPIQAELFEQNLTSPAHWNQAMMLRANSAFEPQALSEALATIIQHHDALRLRFLEFEGHQWSQSYQDFTTDMVSQSLSHEVVSVNDISDLAQYTQESLDIQHGPLIKVVNMQVDDGSARLLIVIHHLAVDGVSWRILLEDLTTSYQAALNGEQPNLPIKSHSFQHWAKQIESYPEHFAHELDYWLSQSTEAIQWPKLNTNGSRRIVDAQSQTIALTKKQTSELLKSSARAYNTQVNDLLLSALSEAIYQWLGYSEIVVNLEGHGREAWDDSTDLSRTVGWFTALYPVKLMRSANLKETICGNKERLHAIPNKGIGYGAFCYYGDPSTRTALKQKLLTDIEFNYLGQFDGMVSDQSNDTWQAASEHSGQTTGKDALQATELAIVGQVANGQLSLTISYGPERIESSAISNFSDIYKCQIENLIEHCSHAPACLTPSDVPLASVTQDMLDSLQTKYTDLINLYPLSPMQQGMLFFAQQGDTRSYVNQMRLDIQNLDESRFKDAWLQVIERHDALRTGFVLTADQPLQFVVDNAELEWINHDLSNETPTQQVTLLDAMSEQQIQQGFDFEKDIGLTRVVLVKTADTSHHMIWTCHHILTDGWSTSQMIGEVLALYDGQQLPSVSGQFKDYIGYITAQDKLDNEQFWRKEVAKLEAPTYMAGQCEGSAQKVVKEMSLSLDETQTQCLNDFTKRHGLTMNTLIQGAWAVLLHRYVSQQHICFGMTTSGRPTDLTGANTIQGLFINTLAVVQHVDAQAGITTWLEQLQKQAIEVREFEYTPLADVTRFARDYIDVGNDGLFDTLLVVENFPISDMLKDSSPKETQFTPVGEYDETNYPLTVAITLGQQLKVRFSYHTEVISTACSERILKHFSALLTSFVTHENGILDDLNGYEEAQYRRLLSSDKNKRPQEKTTLILDMISQHDAQINAQTALSIGDWSLSYAALEAQANQWAHFLIAQGVKAESKVGLIFERSPQMIVAMLAVLKAGAAYVPIDPKVPKERIDFILEDSALCCVITDQNDMAKRAKHSHLFANTFVNTYPVEAPKVSIHPEQLAYIIYTSGSTGKPKGVQVTHANLARLLHSSQMQFEFTNKDVWTFFHSFAFDFSVWEIFGALAYGGKLVLVPYEVSRDPQSFAQLLDEQKVTVLNQTPSAFEQLLTNSSVLTRALAIRWVVFGGEALNPSSLEDCFTSKGFANARFVNMYGITETTVHVTYREITSTDSGSTQSPIGLPLSDLGALILDKSLNLVPYGVAGELYVSGAGLARGYLARPELSAERFIAHPYSQHGERLYRTGDLVRWNDLGELEYLGRCDHQVKIRGFRIELGEIEAQLYQLEQIQEAIVIVSQEASGARLVAYVSGDNLEVSGIKAQLGVNLPDYMIPAVIMILDALPLNHNGKVDRKALPAPSSSQQSNHFIAPIGATEQLIAEVWQTVLETDKVSRTDNFFALGGDSIRALKVVAQSKQADVNINIAELMMSETLADLAQMVDKSNIQALSIQRLDTSFTGVSYGQYRQWVLWKLDPQSDANHISMAMTLKGEVNARFVEQSLNYLLDKHPILRTIYIEQAGQLSQREVETQMALVELDVSALPVGEKALILAEFKQQQVRTAFDLAKAPLMRAALIKHAETEYELVIVQHHIVSDAWSIGIMKRDFVAAYQSLIACQALPELLPALRYSDFAAAQQAWFDSGEEAKQLAFWQSTLDGDYVPLNLPEDLSGEESGAYTANTLSYQLPTEHAKQLKLLARHSQGTLFHVLLSAWQLTLKKQSSRNTIRIGLPIANRQHVDTQDIVGFFVNTLVLNQTINAHHSLADHLKATVAMVNDAQAHQDYPFEKLLDVLEVPRDLGTSPLFQVLFNHQQFTPGSDQATEIEGVTITSSNLPNTKQPFKLVLESFEQQNGEVSVTLSYAQQYFSEQVITRLLDAFKLALTALIEQPDSTVSEMNLFSVQEQQTLLALGEGEKLENSFTPVFCAVDEHANRTPEKLAISGNKTLTYQEVSQISNQAAHFLLAQGVEAEQPIALIYQRTAMAQLAMLAVMKAGGMYIPIAADLPAKRKQSIIEQSGATMVLTDDPSDIQAGCPVYMFTLDMLAKFSAQKPEVTILPKQLAYSIFTSGSTGEPKGVGVSHDAITRHMGAFISHLEVNDNSRCLMFYAYHFDASLHQWLPPLMQGGEVYILGNDELVPSLVAKIADERQLTQLELPPAFLQAMVSAKITIPSMRKCIVGGERFPVSIYRDIQNLHPTAQFYNAYGPTEAVVAPTISALSLEKARDSLPIGNVLGDRCGYVLDSELNLVPQGMIGELYISGESIARGYLNRPNLTAERFVANPFSNNGERMYRTGDRVRWNETGELEYIDRTDNQVQLRGLRIELGEIEEKIMAMPTVSLAVVDMIEERGQSYLVGYYQILNNEVLEPDMVLSDLSEKLPEYMIPSALIPVPQFRLNRNGKIDRKALPEVNLSSLLSQRSKFVPPKGEIEQEIAALWSEVLGQMQVSRQDNFFALGGHSLASISLVEQVNKKFSVSLSPQALFTYSNFTDFAAQVSLLLDSQVSDDVLNDLEALMGDLEDL